MRVRVYCNTAPYLERNEKRNKENWFMKFIPRKTQPSKKNQHVFRRLRIKIQVAFCMSKIAEPFVQLLPYFFPFLSIVINCSFVDD